MGLKDFIKELEKPQNRVLIYKFVFLVSLVSGIIGYSIAIITEARYDLWWSILVHLGDFVFFVALLEIPIKARRCFVNTHRT